MSADIEDIIFFVEVHAQ